MNAKALEELQKIKRIAGIYALIKEGEIVYVGKSSNVYLRILEHSYERIKDFDDIKASYNDDLTRVEVMEVVIISLLKPKLNKLIFNHIDFLRVLPTIVKNKFNNYSEDLVLKEANSVIDIMLGKKVDEDFLELFQ